MIKKTIILFVALATFIIVLMAFAVAGPQSFRYALEPILHRVELIAFNKHYAPLSHKHAGQWISRNDFGNYMLQRRAASDHGLPLIENQRIHDSLVAAGELIRLPVRGDGYRINTPEIIESSPYFCRALVEEFSALSAEWSRRMEQQGFNNSRLVVNSGTRTVPQQKRIAETHPGATKGISAHSYGAALDLVRIEYYGKAGQPERDQARALLKECLNESEAFFWVPEGSNFHLTVKPS